MGADVSDGGGWDFPDVSLDAAPDSTAPCTNTPPTPGSGTTYFIAPTGSDSNAGTSASPFATIQQAGNVAQPGDTFIVRQGSYPGFIFCWDGPMQGSYSTIAGTEQAPITFMADPMAPVGFVVIHTQNDKTPVGIDLEPGCDHIVIWGFNVQADSTITKAGIKATGRGDSVIGNTVANAGGFGVLSDLANDFLLDGNTIIGTTGTGDDGHGYYLSGTNDGAVVRCNVIHDNANLGIHINGDESEGGSGVVTNALIENNSIYDNGSPSNPGNGINADGLQASTIQNNLIWGNSMHGITLYQIDAGQPANDNVIVANTIVQPNSSGVAIEVENASVGNVVFDNILIGGADGTYNLDNASAASFISDYNVVLDMFDATSDTSDTTLTLAQWQSSSGQDHHSIIANTATLFDDLMDANFHLTSQSQAIGAGTGCSLR
jgi:hypothetical protein